MAGDPIAAPLNARFLSALADRVGHEPGTLDNLLVAPPGVSDLQLIPAELDHPRVDRALLHRSDLRTWSTLTAPGC